MCVCVVVGMAGVGGKVLWVKGERGGRHGVYVCGCGCEFCYFDCIL